MHLLGTEIDWKKTVMGKSFHFTNANAIANCGCGTSFSV
jgi:Fe-S cluster assembly iron-binding protein IscA